MHDWRTGLRRMAAGLAMALVAGVLACLLAACSLGDDDSLSKEDAATPAATLAAVRSDGTVKALGKVVPVQQAVLGFAASGAVERVSVEEGDQVQAGDVLARLDSAQQAATMLRAMADLDAANARLRAAEAEAGVPVASVAGDAAGAAGDEPAGADLAEPALAGALAGVDQALAALEQAQVQMDLTVLRAPFAGRVVAVHLGAGEIAALGAPVVDLADDSAWLIETDDLTELDVVDVRVGQRASVTVDAIPDLELEGRVARVARRGEVRMGDVVYAVVVEPARHEPLLRWNMTATVTIESGKDD